jgi:glutathione reductase (NADPH)
VREFVAEQYKVHGLHLHPSATPTEIKKGPDGKLTLVAESKGDGRVVLEGLDHVLMATGRKPNTRGLGCEEVGSPRLEIFSPTTLSPTWPPGASTTRAWPRL